MFKSRLKPVLVIALIIAGTVGLPSQRLQAATVRLFPAKQEVVIGAGETSWRNLTVQNNTGKILDVKVTVEDFRNGETSDEIVKLIAEETAGVYSLKNYLTPQKREFQLPADGEVIVPVQITIPPSKPPGGLYAAVIFSFAAPAAGVPTARLINRLGALFFVKIEGSVLEQGETKRFDLADQNVLLFKNSTPTLAVSFANTGNIYLKPYGLIELRDRWRDIVQTEILDPWFVLPQTNRFRIVNWPRALKPGYYTATAKINRGYGDIVDELEVNFWVLPWPILLGSLIIFLGVGLGFMIKSRTKTKTQ